MKSLILQSVAIFFFLGCSKPVDNPHSSQCDGNTIVSEDLYKSAPKDHLTISKAEIVNNCLKITFSSSGCNGDSWVVKLIDSGSVAESFPVQRRLRLSLKNEEDCDAYITKSISFDLTPIQLVEYNKIILHLDDTDYTLLYEY